MHALDDTSTLKMHCPDNEDHDVDITLIALERPNFMIVMGSCPVCKDGKTVKGYMKITKAVFNNAVATGMPVLKE